MSRSPSRRSYLLLAAGVWAVSAAAALTLPGCGWGGGSASKKSAELRLVDVGDGRKAFAMGEIRLLLSGARRAPGAISAGPGSNIRLQDYAGPQACKSCHAKNYDAWSKHPHRWMNAVADEQTVKGDFSGATISYRGGVARFYTEEDEFRMELKRARVRRVYGVRQTIGSRFQQYYIGRLLEGPEAPQHHAYLVNQVLPFGYWLDRKAWTPIVHVHSVPVGNDMVDEERVPDEMRTDPFAIETSFTAYAERCSHCHTTQPFGDLLIRNLTTLSKHAPRQVDLLLPSYLKETHPDLLASFPLRNPDNFGGLVFTLKTLEPVDHAATLGVSCEACHLGAREHAEGKRARPAFFPASPHLSVDADQGKPQHGRSHANLNWSCGRCHTGGRPQLAAGMGTWNSVEYTDAMQGSCYSKLKCIDCHNPHQATGKKWSRTPAEDDALCLRCHEKLQPSAARQAHTHHRSGSAGSRCMNCHMPHLNEGLQDVVRTHTIFSPTHRGMIEQDHPNACNLCHTRKSVAWAVEKLNRWYATSLRAPSHAQGDDPATVVWLKSENPAVRLLAADALTRTRAKWSLPHLLQALDDSHLLNRQFTMTGLERMYNVRLDQYGYHHYMLRGDRQKPIAQIRKELAKRPVAQD